MLQPCEQGFLIYDPYRLWYTQENTTIFYLAYNAIIFIGTYDTICVTMEFLLIFDETNFVEVLKIHEIREIYGPRNKSTLWYQMNCIWCYVLPMC